MSKRKKLLFIVIPAVVLLLAGAFSLYWFVIRKDNAVSPADNTSEQIFDSSAVVLTEVVVDDIEKIKSDNAADPSAVYTALIAAGMRKSYAGDCRDSNDYFKEAANITDDEMLKKEAYVQIYSCAKQVDDQGLLSEYGPLVGDLVNQGDLGQSEEVE